MRPTVELPGMRAVVLGSLAIEVNGVPHSLSAFKPRQALALLLLNANRTVSVSGFVQELWDDNPPSSALTTLQTYILQLRKFLVRTLNISQATASKHVLQTVPGGYVFRVRPEQLDLVVFKQLAAQGYQSLATRDFATAAQQLRAALNVWQGQALVDVPAGPAIEPQVRGLEEARLVVLEQCIDADLGCGRHREVLSELAALSIEHPYNETLQGQFMLSLHRSGRRSDALETYQRIRSTLIEDVGLEPSSWLQQVHQAVLTDAGPDAMPMAHERRLVGSRG